MYKLPRGGISLKARLLYHNDEIVLLKRNGEIHHISASEAREFLLNFSDPSYYTGKGTWDFDGVTMETYPGKTIACVNDQGFMIVNNSDLFKKVIMDGEADFLSVAEYATLHGKSVAMIRRLCQQGRIPGAFQKGYVYLIPAHAKYPV